MTRNPMKMPISILQGDQSCSLEVCYFKARPGGFPSGIQVLLSATETMQKEEKMDKKMIVSFLVLVLALILFSPGVSQAMSTEVYLTSEPSAAEVYLDGEKIGDTPLTVQVEGLGRDHRLELKKEGCQPNVTTLTNDCWASPAEWYPSIVHLDGTGNILEDATLHIVLKHK